jgi:signal transduction histidine kinase
LSLRIEREALSSAQRECLEARAGEPVPAPSRDVLGLSDAEEALGAWLESRGVSDAWRLAPPLVEAGLDAARLARDFEALTGEVLADALRWLATARSASAVLAQVRQAGLRISSLVSAAKAYAYLDQAPVQEVDVHEGLESTLTMLGYRLHDVEVVREYDRRLPRLTVFGTELNQVWTSLMENALDAMGEHGTLLVRTTREPDYVVVDIVDDGPGIPSELQPRVFEPFFTTKGVGQGTGLGLSLVQRIVNSMHKGEVTFSSRPGETCFRVRLPVLQEALSPRTPKDTERIRTGGMRDV